jgi:hypothetical protein
MANQKSLDETYMATAKPCVTCQAMLKGFGVKIVRYTTETGVQEYEVI